MMASSFSDQERNFGGCAIAIAMELVVTNQQARQIGTRRTRNYAIDFRLETATSSMSSARASSWRLAKKDAVDIENAFVWISDSKDA